MSNTTIFRQTIVALLTCVLCGVRVSAQEKPPVGAVDPSANPSAVPARPTRAAPVADSIMPDISGNWRMGKDGVFGFATIGKAEESDAFFVIENPIIEAPQAIKVIWSPNAQCFEGPVIFDHKHAAKRTLQLLADGKTLRVTVSLDEPARKDYLSRRNLSGRELDERLKSNWTRKSGDQVQQQAPSFAANDLKPMGKSEQTLVAAPFTTAASEVRQIKVFTLANCSAVGCSKLLKELYDDVKFTADTRTNSIIAVSSDENRLMAIEALLLKLDEAPSKPAAPKSDPMISFTPAPSPTATEVADTVRALKLTEQLAEHEAQARLLAEEIRGLSQQYGRQHPKQVEARRQLDEALANALAAKFKLEQLQITSLEERLTRLKSQIGQRQAVSQQIVARRANELIEGDGLKWDSTGAASESAAETSSKSKPTNPTTKPVASSEMTTQVHFTGPKGMEILIADELEALIAPVRHSFLRHASETQRYDIGFMKAPGFPDFQFVALLDIYPSTPGTHGFSAPLPATDEFLRHNTVPITITEADTRQASSELLIKVVYLSKTSSVETAIPEIKTLDSTSINRGGDVIAAANQFGTILAVLRLAKNVDQLGKLDPKSNNAAITRPRLSSQEVANGGTAERSTSSQPSYQEFAKKLGTMNSLVTEAEETLTRAERDAGNDVVIDTVPNARRRVAEALRNRKAIRDEYATVLRDLELQIESAQAEVDAAKSDAEGAERLVKANQAPTKVSVEAQLRLKQATLTLERIKVRYDLYKKAEEGPRDGQSKDEATSLDKPPASESFINLDAGKPKP